MTTVGIYAELKTLSEHINRVQERLNSLMQKVEKEIDKQSIDCDDLDILCAEMEANKRLKDRIEVFTAFGVQKIIMGKEKMELIDSNLYEYIKAFKEYLSSDTYKKYINDVIKQSSFNIERACEDMFLMVENKRSQKAILHLFGLEPNISCIIDTDNAKRIMDKCTDKFAKKVCEDARKKPWKIDCTLDLLDSSDKK